MQNEFEKGIKYGLFRTVREILHPTISKKNISDYNIILSDDLLPVRVFYPEKVTNLEKVIIFIHGNGDVSDCHSKYSSILKNISFNTDQLIIAIDYLELRHKYVDMYNSILNTVLFLKKELIRNDINSNNITFMGDSTGCNIMCGLNYLNGSNIFSREVYFYPTLSLEYFGKSKYNSIEKNEHLNYSLLKKLSDYYTKISYKKDLGDKLLNPFLTIDENNKSKLLLIVGNVDILRDEAYSYSENRSNTELFEIQFLGHGFLKKMDTDIEIELFTKLNDFLK